MRTTLRPPAAIALLLLVLVAPSALAKDVPLSSDVAVEHDVMVPARDGVKLATDVYRPAKDGKPTDERLPVILTRTPYGKDGARSMGRYFAANGYVFVAQDTRGRFKSEGVWHMLTDDGRDGVDCCAWLGKQPWCDGQVGMLGTSYVGGTQHAVALEKAPELKTVIPVDAMSNLGRQSMRNAGAFELRFWNWIFLNAGKGSAAAKDPATAAVLKEMADNRFYYLRNMPTRRGTTPLKLAPEYEQWLIPALEHGADDAFWSQNNILGDPSRYKDVPVYLVGGWYDSWAGNTTANYAALSRTLKGPVYLIMGPWIHGKQSQYAHGQVSFGPDAAIKDELAWRKTWFDRWLKGKENAVGKTAPFATPVRIFVMGTGDGSRDEAGLLNHGGSWRDEQEWPLARTKYTPYYLHGGGALTTDKPGASSTPGPAAPDPGAQPPAWSRTGASRDSTSYQFDPRDPVPTIGGNISSNDDIMVQGAWDQKGGKHLWNFPQPVPVSARNDVLVFRSAPLERDTEVTGEIEVKLWVSSSAVDTDFTAKLVDVYPPNKDWPGGFDLNIGDGIVRARFRDSLKEPKLMEPGKVYPVTVKLYPTSNVFKKGHRIRVDVSSSNFPRFDVNPNTGEPLNDHRTTVVARNTIHHDREHPSHIVLPVIPAK